MIEEYYIKAGCDDKFFAILSYDTERDKFSARVINRDGSPVIQGLYFNDKADDADCRYFIESRIVPPSRMNINDILLSAGLTEYDPWAIFKWVYLITDDRSEEDKMLTNNIVLVRKQ